MDDLGARVRAGDKKALEQLFADNADAISRMAASIAETCSDIDDMVQEALLRAVRSIKDFRWDSSFTTWLYTILLNVKRDFARKAQSPEIVSLDELSDENGNMPCEPRSAIGQPEDEVLRTEERRALVEAIMELPRLDSAVLWMREVWQLSYAEIADNLGCSVDSVRSRLWRVRRRLRENMTLFVPEHGWS